MSETARYLNLVRELALSNFKLKYTGSVLGYLWSLFKPLMYFGVLYVIFVDFFHQNQPDFPLQLFVGIVLFTFFSECTATALGSIAVERVFDALVMLALMAVAIAAPSFPAHAQVGGRSLSTIAASTAVLFGAPALVRRAAHACQPRAPRRLLERLA